LADQAALDRHLNHFGWTARRDRDDAELAAVQALRQRLGPIWESAHDVALTVDKVNALLADVHVSPSLACHPELPDWHMHLAAQDDPLAEGMGAEIVARGGGLFGMQHNVYNVR
jgi:hypothetical protein